MSRMLKASQQTATKVLKLFSLLAPNQQSSPNTRFNIKGFIIGQEPIEI